MSAAQAQPRYVIEPKSNGLSCSTWTITSKQSYESQVYSKWVFGFISGINLENPSGDFLQGRDADGLIAWIDNYCRSNPLNRITQAAVELVKVLRAGR
jgi:hypothetical protein